MLSLDDDRIDAQHGLLTAKTLPLLKGRSCKLSTYEQNCAH